jgi:hypothetical protein
MLNLTLINKYRLRLVSKYLRKWTIVIEASPTLLAVPLTNFEPEYGSRPIASLLMELSTCVVDVLKVYW